MLYPLTPKGDCHGNEEKSQEETSQEEVVFAKKSRMIKAAKNKTAELKAAKKKP